MSMVKVLNLHINFIKTFLVKQNVIENAVHTYSRKSQLHLYINDVFALIFAIFRLSEFQN